MKKVIKYIVSVALFAATVSTANAQSSSAYFLDNYTYGYELNPAFAPQTKFNISIPALGNLNFGINGSIGVENVLFNREIDGQMKTVTFMHPDVSAADFLGGLKNTNRFGASVREGILSFGFRGFGGYNHFTINAVSKVEASIPKGLFEFIKEGVSNRSYQIANVNAHADAYAEVAIQHSHSLDKVLPGLSIGAAVKFLVGVANVDIYMDRADVNLGVDQWTATTKGQVYMSGSGAQWKLKRKDNGKMTIDGIDTDNLSIPSSYGAAIDLGASYKLNKDWKFSLAFTDIGFINWKNTYTASTNGEHTFSTNDYVFDVDDLDSSWDKIENDIEELYQIEPGDGETTRTRALEATMRVGVEYFLPVYRKLSFGLLNTTQLSSRFSWTEFRLSANFKPSKAFELSANYCVGAFGNSFGWALSSGQKGLQAFIGMDYTITKFSKQYVPLTSNANIVFGLNIGF